MVKARTAANSRSVRVSVVYEIKETLRSFVIVERSVSVVLVSVMRE